MKYLRTHCDFDGIGELFDTLEHKSPGLHPKSNFFGRIIPAPTQSSTNLNHMRAQHREVNKICNADNRNCFTVKGNPTTSLTCWLPLFATLQTP